MPALDRALSLARKGHAAAALDVAVAVWRKSRSPQLGDALRTIGEQLKVTDPQWSGEALRQMPAGQAKLQAALTRSRQLRADSDEQSGLMAAMASSAPDPRLGELALRFLFDNGARWATRETAAEYFGPSADPSLREALAARGPVNGRLAPSMSAVCESSESIDLLGLDELSRLFADGAEAFSAQLREAANAGVAAAVARERLLAERDAARKAARPKLDWKPPTPSEKPRLGATHLGPFTAAAAPKAASAPAGDGRKLLLEWRKTKSPELAAQLEASDAAVKKKLAAEARASGLDAAWSAHAKAKDLDATGWLASTLLSDLELVDAPYFAFELDEPPPGLEGDYMALNPDYVRVRFKHLLERLDALEGLLPDPRAAAVLVALVTRPAIDGIKEIELYQRLVRAVVASADPRQAPVLRAALEKEPWKRKSDREFFAEALPPAIAKLGGAGATTPSSRASAAIDSAAVDALISAVLESPNDDQPRRVLADWLMEHGSERGEFIALQLRAKRTATETTRMGSLERNHADDWLGPLARVLTGREWSRGFLRTATLQQNARAPAKVWEAAYSHPGLELIENLHQGKGNARHYAGFLRGGRLCSLDVVCVPDEAKRVLARLAKKKPKAK